MSTSTIPVYDVEPRCPFCAHSSEEHRMSLVTLKIYCTHEDGEKCECPDVVMVKAEMEM